MTRSLGSVWCGVALVSLLVGVTGCNAIGRHKLESNLATEASGCRVKFEGSSSGILKLSPCADSESVDRARRYVTDHCAEIRALDITVITIETWTPRYQSRTWSSTDNPTCSSRCIGSGC
jgi:hypothetical protein